MLLVLASRQDAQAARLVRRWRRRRARLLTCVDLSRPGWEFRPGEPARGRLVVGDQSLSARDVRGVLVRLPAVTAAELPHIDEEDQEYVAMEMMALLVAFLCELPCPVINRPTPLLLTGPAWGSDRWRCEAARLGMAIGKPRRTLALASPPDGVRCSPPAAEAVTVVGERCFGSNHPEARELAHQLARRAGVHWLRVRFARDRARLVFVDADLTPSLEEPAIESAVVQSMLGALGAGSGGSR